MKTWMFVLTLACTASLAVIISGCTGANQPAGSSQAGHDHEHEHEHGHDHEHGEGHNHAHGASAEMTWSGGIGALMDAQGKLHAAFEKKDDKAADNAVHEIAHVLESLPALAKQETGWDEVKQAAVQGALEKLLDLYGALDEHLHGGQGSTYEQIAEPLQEPLKVLQATVAPATVAPAAGAAPAASDETTAEPEPAANAASQPAAPEATPAPETTPSAEPPAAGSEAQS